MRILLDECVPKDLCKSLVGHECQGARAVGLGGKKNGELLKAAEQGGFEVLITVDKNMPHQQNMRAWKLALLVIHAESNKLKDLLPHVAACLIEQRRVRGGQVLTVGR